MTRSNNRFRIQGMPLLILLTGVLTGCILPFNDVVLPSNGVLQFSSISPKVGETFDVTLTPSQAFADREKFVLVLMSETPTANTRPAYVPGVAVVPISDQFDVTIPAMVQDRLPVVARLSQLWPPEGRFRLKALKPGVVTIAVGVLRINPLSSTGYDDANQDIFWKVIKIEP
jgi:hypothetical protein